MAAAGAPFLPAQDTDFRVRHDHWRKHCEGTLRIGPEGVNYLQTAPPGKKPGGLHQWRWSWAEIQQLRLEPRRVRLLTYQDVQWKLGSDRELRFILAGPGDMSGGLQLLQERLGLKLVAVLADSAARPVWQIDAKHPKRLGGSHGTLTFDADRVIYSAAESGESRLWRIEDIESVSSSGPFDLSFTTYERARRHYGSRKDFTFQLKQPLSGENYNRLWRRVNRDKGLQLVESYQPMEKQP